MDLSERIRILTEGAKYDVSCSSSGSDRKGARGAIGSTAACGICHSFTSDGRCISIMKILLSNKCAYDCLYCANRRSADVPRAALEPRELCELVIQFYKRNYIEGLFLSSAVDGSPDAVMQRLTDAVIMLRTEYAFNGYIHLKGIPSADGALIRRAASYVDRMSLNIELPSEKSLRLLAPQKTKDAIVKPMSMLARAYLAEREERVKTVIPAGQTTQMIIGASPDSDGTIMRLTQGLYRIYGLKRVYYSAYMPLGTSSLLPVKPPDTLREHRLYQADWLLRFYGFDVNELVSEDENLPTDVDPKCAWALRNPQFFPVDVNAADHETLLRVPGIGVTGAWRILKARKYKRLDLADLAKMRIVLKRAAYFITCGDRVRPPAPRAELLRASLALSFPASLSPASYARQLSMFAENQALRIAHTGELTQSVLTGEL
jgi:putative DNA modification/repair radical SAM protein